LPHLERDTLGWTGARRNQTRSRVAGARMSVRIGGSRSVGGSPRGAVIGVMRAFGVNRTF
jgi:hypothetical protein